MSKLNKVTEANQVPWPRPDWTDLNDWYLDHAPVEFNIIKYLPLSDAYDVQLVAWHNSGRSIEGFESALWTEREALS